MIILLIEGHGSYQVLAKVCNVQQGTPSSQQGINIANLFWNKSYFIPIGDGSSFVSLCSAACITLTALLKGCQTLNCLCII